MATPTQTAHTLFRFDTAKVSVVPCLPGHIVERGAARDRRFAVVLEKGADLKAAHAELLQTVKQGRARAVQAFGVVLLSKDWRPKNQKEAGDFHVMTAMARVFYSDEPHNPSEKWKGITFRRAQVDFKKTPYRPVALANAYFASLDAFQDAARAQRQALKRYGREFRSAYLG
jgi:hypothetical protein